MSLISKIIREMFYIFALFCLSWWQLTGVFGESVSVTEGDSVTLHTDIQIHEDNILWKFGPEKSTIAKIIREEQITPDVRFRDRLKLDRKTGSLTIMNITSEHAGDYEVKITGAKRVSKTFSVSVYARLPVPAFIKISTSSSSSSLQNYSVLCSVVNVSAVSLSWYKGNSVLSSVNTSVPSSNLSLPLDLKCQDNNTYSCVINNTISNQTTHLDINTFIVPITDQDIPLLYIVLISAAGILLNIASLVMCCIWRKSRKTVETEDEERTEALCISTTRKMKKPDDVYQNVAKK